MTTQLDRIEAKLDLLLEQKKPKSSKTKSRTWVKLVQMMMDDAELSPEQVPYNEEAEQAIRTLMSETHFSRDTCEAVITSYPALDPEEGSPYPWTQPDHPLHGAYESLNDQLNVTHKQLSSTTR